MLLPHLTTDAHGHSILTEIDLRMAGAGAAVEGAFNPRQQAAPQDVSYWQIGQALPGHFIDFTPTPTPTLIAVFSGQANLTASNGEERQLCRGDMLLLQDVGGQGHMTRFLGLEPCTYLTIAMPGGFK